jgi:bifunctional UDP-N-acetylglucosamine pyrophosphorylase/glucosamine-1-phosphate N-acetyltransferase
MADKINTVILAAGKGTRLKIDTPKPLCPALGKKLVDFVVEGVSSFSHKKNVEIILGFVVGHEREKVEGHISANFARLNPTYANQEQQLGTGHALKTYFDKYPEAWNSEFTLVVCADTPLISDNVYCKLYDEINNSGADAICATFTTSDPTGYGRIEYENKAFRIVEEKDANDNQRKINEVNSALYLFKTSHIKNHINNLDDNNNSGEFYLTDLFKPDMNVKTIQFSDEKQFLGVNNLIQLEEVESILRIRKLNELMLGGVRILNSTSVYVEQDVEIAAECVLYPNVSLHGKTIIKAGSTIENGAIIKNTTIGEGVTVKAYSYLEGTNISNNCAIGPMARLREGTNIADDCKIGNFVETKKVNLSKGVKVSHLSYLGDAEVGENTNIGCGFITCNYDGANKHLTKIGEGSFIGSDCQVVAPINIGSKAYIGSGSTINQDVPDGAFAIARQRQVTKPDMANKFIKKK